MTWIETTYTFPIRLSESQERIFIGYVLAVRDSEVINKLKAARAQAKLQVKIPFNPSKPILEGLIMQFDMIESNINNLFILEPIMNETSKYRLRISDSINVKNPLKKDDEGKATRLIKAMTEKKWCDMFLKEMGVESVKVGGE